MQKELKFIELERFWFHKIFKIEKEKGRPNNSDYLPKWLPPEITYTLFNL